MKVSFADFWRLDGRIDRGPYFLIGASLMAVKLNLDRWLFAKLLDRQWSPFDSEFLLDFFFRGNLYPQDSEHSALLLAIALPFLWVGLMLTLRRLRSASLPTWFVVLFFVPLVKFLLFAVLCILPSCDASDRALLPRERWWHQLLPASAWGSAVAATFATFIPAMLFAWLCTTQMQSYSASLFVGIPFCQGFIAAVIHGSRQPRSIGACMAVANLSVLCAGMGFLALAWEGVICLLMAAPLAVVLATLGACFGHAVQRRVHHLDDTAALTCVTLLALPAMMWLEKAQPPELPLLKVTSSVDVAAPPERVWKNVVEFSELPPPDE